MNIRSVKTRLPSRQAFTLFEVLLALTVFGIVVAPAFGLLILSMSSIDRIHLAPNASEIKSLLAQELSQSEDIWDEDFMDEDRVFFADVDYSNIVEESEEMSSDTEWKYRISISEPSDYIYSESDGYRVFVFSITWPAYVLSSEGTYVENTDPNNLEQIVSPVVINR